MSTHTSADRLYSGDLLIAPATGIVRSIEFIAESACATPSIMVALDTPNGPFAIAMPDTYPVEKIDREELDSHQERA